MSPRPRLCQTAVRRLRETASPPGGAPRHGADPAAGGPRGYAGGPAMGLTPVPSFRVAAGAGAPRHGRAGAPGARPSASPAGPSGPRRPRRAGALRRALAAALVLLAGALAALPPGTAHAQTAQSVENNWALKPSAIGPGQSFRLLFVTSTHRDANSANIGVYNSFVQGRANAGHTAIQGFGDEFRALISTSAVDARDNTATTHTNANRGVPIYWLNGNKAADDYADFYDGNWDSNVPRNQNGGTFGSTPVVWTGSNDDGTEATTVLGVSLGAGPHTTRVGAPKTDHREIDNNQVGTTSNSLNLYGLSPVITVSSRPGQVAG